MSPIKVALLALFGTVLLTKFVLLEQLFPHPDESLAALTSQADYDAAYMKISILHTLIFMGVFMVGAMIMRGAFQ